MNCDNQTYVNATFNCNFTSYNLKYADLNITYENLSNIMLSLNPVKGKNKYIKKKDFKVYSNILKLPYPGANQIHEFNIKYFDD